MAGTGKYSEEVVKTITSAIEETGRDEDGYTAARISADTFYRWIRDKPEFARSVLDAKKHFQAHSIPQLKRLAKMALRTHLESIGKQEVTRKVREVFSPEGDIVKLEELTYAPVKLNMTAIQYILSGFDAKLARYEEEIDKQAAKGEESDESISDRLRQALGIPTAELSEKLDRGSVET